MILTSLGSMAVALTIAAFWLKRVVLSIGAAFAWLVFAVDAYIVSAGVVTTAAYWVFWFGIAMTIGMALEAAITRRPWHEIHEEEAEPEDKDLSTHPVDKLRKKHGMAPSEARERRKYR
jgi:hypothetical protein